MAVATVVSMTCANYVILWYIVPWSVCACDCDGVRRTFYYADVFWHKFARSRSCGAAEMRTEADRARTHSFCYDGVTWSFRPAIWDMDCAVIVTILGDASHSRPTHNH